MMEGQQPNTKMDMKLNGVPPEVERHCELVAETYRRGFLDGVAAAAQITRGNEATTWPRWNPRRRCPWSQESPEPPEPELALSGHFQYWSGPAGWRDYACAGHQVALTNAWEKRQSDVCVDFVVTPTTLNLEDRDWIYKITLGELCEPPGGHADIVGYQVAVPPSGEEHRTRWVRLVGAENSNQISIMSPKHIECASDCRPPNKPHS